MPNYIYNLNESEIKKLEPKINLVVTEFLKQISLSTVGHNFPPQNTFVEDFCLTVKAQTKVIFDNILNKMTNSVVSSEEAFKEGISDGLICKVNVLKFLEITEKDFKDYLDDKKKLSEICEHFR